MIQKTIETMPGVDSETDGGGMITATIPDGSTLVELDVKDADGGPVTVYLNYRQAVALTLALAECAAKL